MATRDTSISPPPKRRRVSPPRASPIDLTSDDGIQGGEATSAPERHGEILQENSSRFIKSPVQLNFIPELPASSNRDCISLGSILGDPLIKECWLFNYLFDVDFVLQQFDPDVRSLVQIKLVHGSWRREDRNRVEIEDACRRHANVQAITAYMPEAFGTHHSKVIVLFRHDDTAQVVIMTGNLIEQDWSMSQAFWCSRILYPVKVSSQQHDQASADATAPLGSGRRFKYDLLAYIAAYGDRLRLLHKQIQGYDFAAVRAALIASVPSKSIMSSTTPQQNLWGLRSLSAILKTIPCHSTRTGHIVTQISSVASMGEKWLTETFFPALATTATPSTKKAIQRIMFPTPDEIRNSILGYISGGSIHMKLGSAAQQRQVDFLKPMLCHWAPASRQPGQTANGESNSEHGAVEAKARRSGRHPAAPHIKTYVRFSDESMRTVDWAMVTSANMSTQAWGTRSPQGEWRVCSYEIGVVVWPGLWDNDTSHAGDDDGGKCTMVPVFNRDTPTVSDLVEGSGIEADGEADAKRGRVVGFRMPYDLPLRPYKANEVPWCNSQPYAEKDWMGRAWRGY